MSKQGQLSRRTFRVQVDELRAMLLFASQDDTRFMLNGIHVEVINGKPILAATDGRRLAVIESVSDQSEQPAEVDFELTLSASFVKPLCAFAKSFNPRSVITHGATTAWLVVTAS